MHATRHPPLSGLATHRELRECVSCGARFVGWNWHSRCRDCYRRTHSNPDQARPAPDAELKRLRGELEAVHQELARRGWKRSTRNSRGEGGRIRMPWRRRPNSNAPARA